MPIPFYRITSGTNRDIIPPICLGAALRQTSFAARNVESRERANMPHGHAAAPTPNPKSTFSRIIPMNPEPTAASAQYPKSTFSRIIPMNPEPAAGEVLPGTHDRSIPVDLRLHPIDLRGSRTSLYNRQIASVGLLSTAEQRCAQAG